MKELCTATALRWLLHTSLAAAHTTSSAFALLGMSNLGASGTCSGRKWFVELLVQLGPKPLDRLNHRCYSLFFRA